ncbi:penicillin-binding transpeptidase domain-containing protein [Bariatricus massiliensis]|uniref:Peptidoglycan glycosyltransferase n=1 Tax=Bariatricus massiliensis TaxID=1745713 RepID=A0ABS8DEI1_9FIRM|nr:penicillin-binding transpeptidase domain-containing protein [Bariatricus massiliensis]MCB7302935.1 peptidoglycan glycosyltransferase [Bariatricus massiliensis]MCB7374151.1 peptidoglycan glycosyltransferase [Bariatricus massiliensis]MCB7386821.1 peptidoglycan glycosyltransferase [Bariatricus massiliensis]MCB7410983.1 peptidoglycan glycosyltransferase [Bariatricus massiliensis]MCQ5251809.1 penicillin-binding transpeptidase domain-containing protein [Bariatricus massiliensis]
MRNKTYNKKKTLVVFLCALVLILGLIGRLIYLMVFDAEYYQKKAEDLHERERDIKAARGEIVDRNGEVLATNKTVCTISVIHNQVKDKEAVISMLVKELGLSEAEVRKRVEKVSSMERIKTNVAKEVGDRIREYEFDGVKVDEDFKRYYPYEELASKVLGFTGGDNQGIIGLEVKYEDILKGENGMILTTTDARGVELDGIAEDRVEPVAGDTLQLSIDYNLQAYAQQAAEKVMEEKQADGVAILLMNPQNGEVYACVNVPEFNLNEPFTLNTGTDTTGMDEEKKQELLNQMWRNRCINDTYEPGSIFKVFTASAALEEGVVSLNDQFHCPGYKIVEDRKIRCAKVGGHGSETFVQGVQNSCNPVFIEVGLRLGVDNFYKYMKQFKLLEKTGVDLPGEAATIMHKKENVGLVELATMSFGQSFQITPMQMAATVSSLINGGRRITPHFGVCAYNAEGQKVETFDYGGDEQIVSSETSATMRAVLETVVSEGGGKNAYIEGYRIGGKTATSQTLPRSANKYISSFIGFAPADDPKIIGMCIIYNPQGVYYGGTIAAPVIRDIFDNVLPYMGIEKAAVPETEENTEENAE